MSKRKVRVVILTKHYINETDVMRYRVGMITKGELMLGSIFKD